MISTLYRGKNTRIIKVNPFHDDTTADEKYQFTCSVVFSSWKGLISVTIHVYTVRNLYPCRSVVNCSSEMVLSIRYSTIKKKRSGPFWISRNTYNFFCFKKNSMLHFCTWKKKCTLKQNFCSNLDLDTFSNNIVGTSYHLKGSLFENNHQCVPFGLFITNINLLLLLIFFIISRFGIYFE
jgi:hypothetical protein